MNPDAQAALDRDPEHARAMFPVLLGALEALTDWGREHTGPRDPNSPHLLLIAAVNAIGKARGLLAVNVSQSKDGYWQWCDSPPGADSVYGGFESEAAAYADAHRVLKG